MSKVFVGIATVVLCLLSPIAHGDVINHASPDNGGSYVYSNAKGFSYPGAPSFFLPAYTDPTSEKLNDGVDGLVLYTSAPIIAFFDLGQDKEVTQAVAYSKETPWNNNGIAQGIFYFASEATGDFTGDRTLLAAQADSSIAIGSVDKSSAAWELNTGTLVTPVTARYVVFTTVDGTSGTSYGITEVEVLGESSTIPEPASYILLGIGGSLIMGTRMRKSA